ncbi:hypothetical protein QBC34DRAFT_499250 [Podospora aff. communis PSN243]|uniref:FAD-binding FR-type domain-containing protein n=1 Tax=Podospora aff. communis PSN243 TaxID=3040156 RepID=A0AAV9G6D1_9PEZI|nr:hypothetical protein QBC34DRAFT_499250 [Podospora aff. communis PSN243]
MATSPLHYSFRPVVSDRHTAARAYFLCVIAMILLESMVRLPEYLPAFTKRRTQANHSRPRIYLHKLLTLPSPLPFLTHHTVASLLRCLVFTALNILWGWNRIRYSTDYQLYGWLTIANAGLALLLPTRNNLFSIIARIPPPILLNYHRWAGIATVAHVSLHFGLTAAQYIQTSQFATVVENARIRIGILAWAALALIFLTSLRIIRRRAFELFYYTHFAFLVFAAGAFYHASHALEFMLPGLALWFVDRAVRIYYCFFRDVSVAEVTHGPGGMTKLKVEGIKTTCAAQMVWVQIPVVSRVNWHPFTVASTPGDVTGTVAIRGLGGYTRRVAERLERPGQGGGGLAPGSGPVMIRIDGPYGVEPIPWARYPVVALVAGGIGITPAISIASWVVKEAARGALAGGRGRHVHLLWSVADIAHAGWFADELKSLAALASAPSSRVSLQISIHVTGRVTGMVQEEQEMDLEGAKYEGPGEVHRGRPNVAAWLQQVKLAEPGCDVALYLRRPACDCSLGGLVGRNIGVPESAQKQSLVTGGKGTANLAPEEGASQSGQPSGVENVKMSSRQPVKHAVDSGAIASWNPTRHTGTFSGSSWWSNMLR